MADYSAARRAMVETQIRPAAVHNERLLQALGQVPREAFVPEQRRGLAYTDGHQPLNVSGRYLAAPAVFAQMVQLADCRPEDRVLDVGCGSGYSVAIFEHLASAVDGVETDDHLRGDAAAALTSIGAVGYSLLSQLPTQASGKQYEVIFVGGMLAESPDELLPLLVDGGRLVVVLRNGPTGVAWVYERDGERVTKRSYFNAILPSALNRPVPTDFVF
ncbi:protein-L-isoaspartate O-methyltransferase [Devosia sp. MC532]|uniref:protein-L-isoaspartate O-methyltransferase family protein n=1 Tax=Devosia sp. MC532 TaxID=2799788 RepID=UPI0018F54C6E|nr:protein-L-isoaspartate O-methyltransferase [Devosia sp. MC532]MBJ7576640.1 protein-L-isoaspartate O-methyltransferase [Devosia sp. MC532]